MSAPTDPTTDPAASHRAVENLVARYAELVDDGDFAGLGTLLADAAFTGSGAPVRGSEAIGRMFRDTSIVHADGAPRTQDVTTNTAVEIDEPAGTAVARSYVTVLQALPTSPCRPSPPAATTTGSNAGTAGGGSRSGGSASPWSAT